MACTYSLGKSVPANAVFVDTWRDVVNNLTSTDASKSLSAAQGKVLNDTKARILRTAWGKTLTIPGIPHGFVLYDNWEVYLIWVAGVSGAHNMDVSKIFGVNENLTFSINRSDGTVTASLKDTSSNAGIVYIGT